MYSYEKEQERWRSMMADNASIEEFDDDDEEGEEDVSDVQQIDSDSEAQISDGEIEIDTDKSFFLGRDRTTTWFKYVPESMRVRPENLIIDFLGVRGAVKDLRTPMQIWKHFFSDEMMHIIVVHTNKRIETVQNGYTREGSARLTNVAEIQAMIGLLYLAGVMKLNYQNTDELWRNDGLGVEIFRLTMSLERFRFLIKNLRFDDMRTREPRKKFDNLAPIRTIFDSFVVNCKIAYSPYEYVTFDEKLESFRGKCSFKQYLPSKPNKYGIKMFVLTDSKTYYTSNMEVYLGNQPNGPYDYDYSPSAIVERLCESIKGSGRNITVVNGFSNLELAESLLENYRLTFVGGIMRSKKEIPSEFIRVTGRPPGSTLFGFRDQSTLVSYVTHRGNNLTLLSTLHHDDSTDITTGEPDILGIFNQTRGNTDYLCALYDCARKTLRWPMVIFYSLLNVAGINSLVIFSANNPTVGMPRKEFLQRLAYELVAEHLRSRATMHNKLSRNIIARIRELIGVEPFVPAPDVGPPANGLEDKVGRCAFCSKKRNRPTRYTCKNCRRFICFGDHAICVCGDCYERAFMEI